MEKINLRPLFKFACSTADIKRIMQIPNKQANRLSEEQNTKNLLAYFTSKETRQSRNNIVSALDTENVQPNEPVRPALATWRKM